MNILQVMYYPNFGGTEEYILNLTKEFKKNGHQVFFVYSKDGRLVERLKEADVILEKINMRSPFDLVAIFNAYKFLRKNKIDAIQTNFLRENFIFSIAGKLAGTKAILTSIHRIEKKNKVQEFFQRFYSRFVDRYIATHNVVKEYLLAEGIEEKKIAVIHNAIPAIDFYSKESSRKRLGLKNEDFVIGSIGRVSPEKSYDTFIDLANKLKDVNFIVLGSGPLLETLRQENKNSNLAFYGHLEEAFRYMKAFDIFALTSDIEVMPTVILEAMLAKVPIISTPVGGVPELLGNGKYGKLSEKEDLVNAITELKGKKDFKVIDNAHNEVKNEYSFSKIANELINLIKQISS